MVASIYAAHGTQTGHDVLVGIIVDGQQCATNRFPATPGMTGQASASCSRWIPAGQSTITMYLTGSTGIAVQDGTGISAGVLVL